MQKEIDYINLFDIAKMNLNKHIQNAIEIYKKDKNYENKVQLIKLIQDRKNMFLFDKKTIAKYL